MALPNKILLLISSGLGPCAAFKPEHQNNSTIPAPEFESSLSQMKSMSPPSASITTTHPTHPKTAGDMVSSPERYFVLLFSNGVSSLADFRARIKVKDPSRRGQPDNIQPMTLRDLARAHELSGVAHLKRFHDSHWWFACQGLDSDPQHDSEILVIQNHHGDWYPLVVIRDPRIDHSMVQTGQQCGVKEASNIGMLKVIQEDCPTSNSKVPESEATRYFLPNLQLVNLQPLPESRVTSEKYLDIDVIKRGHRMANGENFKFIKGYEEASKGQRILAVQLSHNSNIWFPIVRFETNGSRKTSQQMPTFQLQIRDPVHALEVNHI